MRWLLNTQKKGMQMARIRTIKPEFPHSESMGNVSRDARLAFILMWTIADDSGRLRGNSRMLASLLFPYDDDAAKKIDGWIGELQGQNCLVRYKSENAEYIQIKKWLEHQRIDKPSASKIPAFQDDSQIIREDSTKPPVRKGKEGKGVEGIVGKEYTDDFLTFWELYPRKDGSKKIAFDIYFKIIKSGVDHGRIESGVAAYADSVRREATERKFIKLPETWLNKRCWESDYSTTQRHAEQPAKSKWIAEGDRLAAKYLAEG